MLRISLIVAILAGLAALTVSQLKVAKDLQELRAELKTTQDNLTTSQAAESKARRDAREASDAAEKAKRELETTKTDLAAAAEKADQQEKRANDLDTRLQRTTQERNDAQAELSKWTVFGMSIEQIRAALDQNRKLVAENDVLSQEKVVLLRKIRTLENDLAYFTGESVKVPLPATLKGKVIAVDPKYEFVVLDIGETDGVLKRGEMVINRSGRLVAKVRILTVDANRCVANVLPDWKQSEIMEGDVAIVGL